MSQFRYQPTHDLLCFSLHRLVLSSNGIRTIPNLKLHPSPIENVKQLALSANQLAVWQDVDRLAQWCPRLETLSLAGNPLTEDSEFARYSRQLVIAKIPSLLVLDATAKSSGNKAGQRVRDNSSYLVHSLP
ncbi:hypothetical protein ID866_4353 [Astraeus odoratus]|nr:hypothetical protein ID866_4353 [Astraeus odoratus]